MAKNRLSNWYSIRQMQNMQEEIQNLIGYRAWTSAIDKLT